MPFSPVKWTKSPAPSKCGGDGLGGWLPQTLWLPVLAQAPRGQHLGQAVLWLAQGKPQPAFRKTEPCSPLCTGPSRDDMCESAPSAPLGTGVHFWGPERGPMAALAKMHAGFSQKSPVAKLLPRFSEESGSGLPEGLLEVSPLPGSRPGEGNFGTVSAQRWPRGTGPLGQCRC